MVKKNKKHSTRHYKVNNVLYMQDFLCWKKQQKERAAKVKQIKKLLVALIVVSLFGFYIFAAVASVMDQPKAEIHTQYLK